LHTPYHPWFAAVVALSAALLFCVEPLWARLVLPRYGGSAAVWSTLLVLYQALLLAGYGLAHLTATRSLRLAFAVWAGLALAGLAGMPLQASSVEVAAGASPALALLVESLRVAPAFLLLAMTGPLVQRQFARIRPGADPYPLYAASNVGSIGGLVAFPLAEATASLPSITHVWAVALLLCVALTWGALALPAASAPPAALAHRAELEHPRSGRGWTWFGLTFGPSSVLVGLTTWLATAIAAVPMLWVLPLLMYLLSFVVAFARSRPSVQWTGRAAVLAMVPVTLALALDANHPTWAVLAVHLAGLFAVALACHRRLASLQPEPDRLTRFYLVQAAGGVTGGIAASLVAPTVLDGPLEYPLALVASLGLAFGWAPLRDLGKAVVWAMLPGVAALGVAVVLPALRTPAFALAVLAAYLLSRQPGRFVVAVAAVVVAAAVVPTPQSGSSVHAARGFYGIHSVTRDGDWMQLRHGVTVHGRQRIDQRDRCVPQLYYHRTGPIGQLLTDLPLSATATVGAVGQGTGCIACYARSGQAWTFFEIDPLVDAIARDPRWFTYLQRAPVHTTTIVGDLRTTLAAWQGPPFDLLVLDAYSSDSIPLHLLTVEAMDLYWRRVRHDGVLVLHVSNRYFDLPPMVAALARSTGAIALVREDAAVSQAERAEGKTESVWVAVARDQRRLGSLGRDDRWKPVPPTARAWTDAAGSALDVLDVR